MQSNKENLMEVCEFLKKFGYIARITSSPINCDIRVPEKKLRIQVAIAPYLEDKELILFLGTKHKEEIRWRLTRADYFILSDPLNYYIMQTKALKELIEINGWYWKKEYRINSRRNSKAILIKVPKSFIVYGLLATNDIQIFNKSEK